MCLSAPACNLKNQIRKQTNFKLISRPRDAIMSAKTDFLHFFVTGLNMKYFDETDLRKTIPTRERDCHKGTFGYTALIGGSTRYSGAIRLAYLANAAMRSGAGVVKVAAPCGIVGAISAHILESTIFPLSEKIEGNDHLIRFVQSEIDELIGNVKTVTVGMGIGLGSDTEKLLEYLLANYRGQLIIDADALTILSGMDKALLRSSYKKPVLTPHMGEFSRLLGVNNPAQRIENARNYARDTNTILLLKGPTTVITDGAETILVEAGCPGMATAGSGDVLSGILSALCAYCTDTLSAVAASAYINGKAGEAAQKEVGPTSLIASDTVSKIPEILYEGYPL